MDRWNGGTGAPSFADFVYWNMLFRLCRWAGPGHDAPSSAYTHRKAALTPNARALNRIMAVG